MKARIDVAKVARLARLGLEAAEERRLAAECGAILQFVAQVRALPLAGVVPSVHSLATSLPLAADQVRPGLSQEAALAAAPAQRDGFLQVPAILPGTES